MKTLPLFASIVLMAAVSAMAQDAPPQPKPGPEHEVLKKMAGEWNAKVTCHTPGGDMESTGEYKATMDVGGLFLFTEMKCKIAGQDFHGRGISGYDPYQKKYTTAWVDSMSPAIYTCEGELSKSGDEFRETMRGPGPDGKPMTFRTTTTFKDKDTMHFAISMPGEDGKDQTMMEIVYTRKK